MAATSISVAQTLTGALTTIAKTEGFEHDESVLAMSDLALALSHFKEEGIEMFPEVLVARGVDEVARALQAQDRIKLGSANSATNAARRMLKHAAPLCRDGWLAYVQVESSVEYGMLRQSSSPLSVPLTTGISGCESAAILFYQDVSGAVRIVGARGSVIDIKLTELRAEATPEDPIASLAQAIVADLPEIERDKALNPIKKILTRALRVGHGALVAVVPGRASALPADVFTEDVISLPPNCCLDFGATIRTCTAGDRASVEDIGALEGAASLLTGMMASDGITVFSSCAQVLAFRCFVASHAGSATGGARRRTYMRLCEAVGPSLSAAFTRSHDGRMAVKRAGR